MKNKFPVYLFWYSIACFLFAFANYLCLAAQPLPSSELDSTLFFANFFSSFAFAIATIAFVWLSVVNFIHLHKEKKKKKEETKEKEEDRK